LKNNPQKTDRFLKRIKIIVQEREPSAKIYLYGSRARETSTKDSDWDLLILVNKDEITYEVERNILDPLYELEFDTGEVISPMVYSDKEWNSKYRITPYYSNVMREGKLL
jgi:predicted nucleotidyltransferase